MSDGGQVPAFLMFIPYAELTCMTGRPPTSPELPFPAPQSFFASPAHPLCLRCNLPPLRPSAGYDIRAVVGLCVCAHRWEKDVAHPDPPYTCTER